MAQRGRFFNPIRLCSRDGLQISDPGDFLLLCWEDNHPEANGTDFLDQQSPYIVIECLPSVLKRSLFRDPLIFRAWL